MKIPVGIVGYGNLGQNVEKHLLNSDIFELKAVFSKRSLINAVPYSKIENYKDKIELLFLCGGSQNELESQSFNLIQNFSIAESYDNHARLESYISKLDLIAKENKKVALCSFGWDPGLFSFMRGLFDSLDSPPYTFWGKGLSQGHTQAIKNISGVIDAVQFTIPNEDAIDLIKQGIDVERGKLLHKRQCFVVANKADKERIYREIVTMPDYFDGYETEVNFVSQEELNSIKIFSHRGSVLSKKDEMNFSLELNSNPDFTSRVLTTFARNYASLKEKKEYGSFTIFDLPLSNILKQNKYKYL